MSALAVARRFTAKHRVIAGVTFCVVMLVVGTLGGKALAAPVPDRTETVNRGICNPNPDTICASQRRHVRHFKAGNYGKAHGVHVRLFHGPAAKAVLMRKIARRLPDRPFRAERFATCAKAPAWACAPAKVEQLGGTSAGHRRCMASKVCRAYNRYGALASGATCIGVDATYLHPNCIPFKLQNPGWGGFTKRQIQIGGATALCGAGVVAGVATGVGTVIVIIGASACGWGFWTQVDPG